MALSKKELNRILDDLRSNRIISLNLRNVGLTREQSDKIYKALEHNKSLTSINLQGNNIGYDLLYRKRDIISRNCKIRDDFLKLVKDALKEGANFRKIEDSIKEVEVPLVHQSYALEKIVKEVAKHKGSQNFRSHIKVIKFLLDHNVPINDNALFYIKEANYPQISALLKSSKVKGRSFFGSIFGESSNERTEQVEPYSQSTPNLGEESFIKRRPHARHNDADEVMDYWGDRRTKENPETETSSGASIPDNTLRNIIGLSGIKEGSVASSDSSILSLSEILQIDRGEIDISTLPPIEEGDEELINLVSRLGEEEKEEMQEIVDVSEAKRENIAIDEVLQYIGRSPLDKAEMSALIGKPHLQRYANAVEGEINTISRNQPTITAGELALMPRRAQNVAKIGSILTRAIFPPASLVTGGAQSAAGMFERRSLSGQYDNVKKLFPNLDEQNQRVFAKRLGRRVALSDEEEVAFDKKRIEKRAKQIGKYIRDGKLNEMVGRHDREDTDLFDFNPEFYDAVIKKIVEDITERPLFRPRVIDIPRSSVSPRQIEGLSPREEYLEKRLSEVEEELFYTRRERERERQRNKGGGFCTIS